MSTSIELLRSKVKAHRLAIVSLEVEVAMKKRALEHQEGVLAKTRANLEYYERLLERLETEGQTTVKA